MFKIRVEFSNDKDYSKSWGRDKLAKILPKKLVLGCLVRAMRHSGHLNNDCPFCMHGKLLDEWREVVRGEQSELNQDTDENEEHSGKKNK